MPPVNMSAMVNNLDQRISAVEQILPTLATKTDLEAFATKEDLKAFATKEDLGNAIAGVRAEIVDVRSEIADVRSEIAEKFDEAKRFAIVLHEDLKGDIRLIAEHLSDVMNRMPPRSTS